MTFFLQIKIRLVKWNNYVMIQVFFLHETCLRNDREGKMGKVNDKMENIQDGSFCVGFSMISPWFQKKRK